MHNFTAPSISLPAGTSQPHGQEEVCKPLSNLFRAPLIVCRSQSSEYHELSRILIIKSFARGIETSFIPRASLIQNESFKLSFASNKNLFSHWPIPKI